MRNDDRFINSPGTRYFPEAFEPEPYKLGKAIANDSNFYRALLQYILLVMATPIQLVHFRAAIIKEVIRSAGDDRSALNKRELPIPKVTWCALSLASDRYFDETARGYGWPEADMELIRSQWYDIIAPAFVPTDTNRRLDIAVILQFAVEVEKLHHRDIGPFPACDLCQAKCRYNYQVEQLIQDAKLQSDFQACVRREDTPAAESVAWFCRLLTNRLIGKDDVNLAFCMAVHLGQTPNKELRSRLPDYLGEQVHAALASFAQENGPSGADSSKPSIEEQILEVIVRQAMAGGPWQQTCAATMQKNNITEEQVEAEILRRKQSIVELFALDSHGSAAVLSGRGVRSLALEALAKQASAGIEWQQISSHTVRCFNITQAEVDAEVRRLLGR